LQAAETRFSVDIKAIGGIKGDSFLKEHPRPHLHLVAKRRASQASRGEPVSPEIERFFQK
jgi:hypothetical protein